MCLITIRFEDTATILPYFASIVSALATPQTALFLVSALATPQTALFLQNEKESQYAHALTTP